MPIGNVSFTNTFAEWMSRTNQLIVAKNDMLGDGLTTYRNITANTANANSFFVGTTNVGSTLSSSFGQANQANATANTAFIIAPAAFDRANLANGIANTSLATGISAFDRANLANGTANTSLATGISAFDRANLANGTANTALINIAPAFDRSNLANLNANTINGANTGTGSSVFKDRTGANLRFRSVRVQRTIINTGAVNNKVTDADISITQNADDLTITLSVTKGDDQVGVGVGVGDGMGT